MKLIKNNSTITKNYSGDKSGTNIDNDGITVTQSSQSNICLIQSDTPISRKGKYVFEINIITCTPCSGYAKGFSFALMNNKENPYFITVEELKTQINFFCFFDFEHAWLQQVPLTFSMQDGDIIGVGWDLGNKKVEIFINGKSVFSQDVTSIFSMIDFNSTTQWPNIYPGIYFWPQYISSMKCKLNFGQHPHTYNYDGYIDPYYETIPNPSLKQY